MKYAYSIKEAKYARISNKISEDYTLKKSHFFKKQEFLRTIIFCGGLS